MWGKRAYWGFLGKPVTESGMPPGPAWTVDAALGWACPANATEWAALIASEPGNTALASWSTVHSIYNCQDSTAPIVDSVGTEDLALYGSGHAYQQTVTGATRKGIALTDGVTGGWRNFSTTIPDLSTTSCLILAYIKTPASASGAYNMLHMGGATAASVRMGTNGIITAVSGGNATSGLSDERDKTIPVVIKVDVTAGVQTVYTLQDKIIPTMAALSGRSMYLGSSSNAGNYHYLYAVRCDGAAGERTDAQVKALLTKLTGTPPSWT